MGEILPEKETPNPIINDGTNDNLENDEIIVGDDEIVTAKPNNLRFRSIFQDEEVVDDETTER